MTVLELAPQIMGRQLDAAASEMLVNISEAAGISIHTGVQISEITGEESAKGVSLADGRVFPAELVIISAGVRANTALAGTAGVEINRGILVNANMETSVENIYAFVEIVRNLKASITQYGRRRWSREKLQVQMQREKRKNILLFPQGFLSME